MNDSLINLTKSNLKLAVEPTPYIRSFLQVIFFSKKNKKKKKKIIYFIETIFLKNENIKIFINIIIK